MHPAAGGLTVTKDTTLHMFPAIIDGFINKRGEMVARTRGQDMVCCNLTVHHLIALQINRLGDGKPNLGAFVLFHSQDPPRMLSLQSPRFTSFLWPSSQAKHFLSHHPGLIMRKCVQSRQHAK